MNKAKRKALVYKAAANAAHRGLYSGERCPRYFHRGDLWWALFHCKTRKFRWLYRYLFYYKGKAEYYKHYWDAMNNLSYTNFDELDILVKELE